MTTIHLINAVSKLAQKCDNESAFLHIPITILLIQMEKPYDEVKMKYCMNDSIIHDNDSVCL
jgi:hypothetical protein